VRKAVDNPNWAPIKYGFNYVMPSNVRVGLKWMVYSYNRAEVVQNKSS